MGRPRIVRSASEERERKARDAERQRLRRQDPTVRARQSEVSRRRRQDPAVQHRRWWRRQDPEVRARENALAHHRRRDPAVRERENARKRQRRAEDSELRERELAANTEKRRKRQEEAGRADVRDRLPAAATEDLDEGDTCNVCGGLWFKEDPMPLHQLPTLRLLLEFPKRDFSNLKLCASCKSSVKKGEAPRLSTSNGFVCPSLLPTLPELNLAQVTTGSTAGKTGRSRVVSRCQETQATVAACERGAQCCGPGHAQEATQTDDTTCVSAGCQTEAEFSEIETDIFRFGVCCERCGRFFTRRSNARRHWQIKHGGGLPRETKSLGKPVQAHESYVCRLCPKRYRRKCDLAIHERVHAAEQPYPCGFCEKRYHRRWDLEDHERRVHTGEKPYACRICPQRYLRKNLLVEHERIHTGERPHVCSICLKSFSRRKTLAEHKRVHTGEKRYVCSVCHKSYARSTGLSSHMKVHTGEKPYSCTVCQKSFPHRRTLVVHLKGHAREKPHSSGVCVESFAQTTMLAIDERAHSGESLTTAVSEMLLPLSALSFPLKIAHW